MKKDYGEEERIRRMQAESSHKNIYEAAKPGKRELERAENRRQRSLLIDHPILFYDHQARKALLVGTNKEYMPEGLGLEKKKSVVGHDDLSHILIHDISEQSIENLLKSGTIKIRTKIYYTRTGRDIQRASEYHPFECLIYLNQECRRKSTTMILAKEDLLERIYREIRR